MWNLYLQNLKSTIFKLLVRYIITEVASIYFYLSYMCEVDIEISEQLLLQISTHSSILKKY